MLKFNKSNYDKAQELLKSATIKKKENDLEGALVDLNKAYEITSKDPNDALGIEAHLRYPKYLLLAGKNDEAWSQLSLLLSKGYPGQNKEWILTDFSAIYKAMSQLHKKEKNTILEKIYDDMSFLALTYHHYLLSIEMNIEIKETKEKFPGDFDDMENSHEEVYLNMIDKEFLKNKINKKKLNVDMNEYINLFIAFSRKLPESSLMGGAFVAEFNKKANLLFN